MAEYNKVMTQIKPDLPKVIDTEQIYVYVPKASYDQAGIIKPDKTQFVIAGDYTLTIKHFEMTDDHVAVDVNMGYKNDTALEDLADKDFVTKGSMTGYAVKKLENNTATDKAYVEGANGTGTKLVDVSDGVDGGSIVKRDAQGRIFGKTTGTAGDNELVNIGYLETGYVKKVGSANRVYTTDNTGADSSVLFSDDAVPDTMAYRAHDGSLHGAVVTPLDTTLLNNKYISEHYIPVGEDGKIPNSYLPADIGADEIVSGYYFEGAFYADKGHTTVIAGDPEKLYVDLDTNKTYRWDATAGYVQVGSSLALGTTHDSAYYGDFGDKAYKHSQATGNPHNTQITDITGLKNKLDSKVSVYGSFTDADSVVAFIADQNSPVMCNLYNSDNSGAFYSKSIGTTTWKRLYSTNLNPGITFLRDEYEPQIKIEGRFTPIINGVRMTSPEITLPMAMHIEIEFDTSTSGNNNDTYLLNFKQSDEKYIVYTWLCQPADFSLGKRYKVPLYSSDGTLRTNSPLSSEDCINLGYWQTNYKPFNYTTISTLSAVEHGFNVEYQIDGKSAEIEIPLEGTDDIVVDIDETNKMINIHLDAKVREKLVKMLTLPAEAPAKNSIVGVGTNNAQMIMTEQEARDAISVFKTVTISQTDYDNLAVKDNKTLYLITG